MDLAQRLFHSPAATPAGIVHLGLGAFFRAHGASYVADANIAIDSDWGVIGVSLQSPATRDQLRPQGWAYTALELAPGSARTRVLTVLRDVLVAPEDPAAVLEAMAAPDTAIVSLTVTEKGYCHEPATGRLKVEHRDIEHDLANPLPRTAPGFLVRALALRRDRGLGPFTVLSCDNLPANGALVRRIVLEFAARVDPALADWIAVQGAFPSTMVDRIVPATTAADVERVAGLTGFHDAAPVLHEPFRQWVIEDWFCGPRPAFETAGAQIVPDVTPFEAMKLRMLNATHSALAYLGFLAGYATVADAIADPALRGFIARLWRSEIIPALTPPEGMDLGRYAEALAARYSNAAVRHRTAQIAMDGSQKLPQRILETLAGNRAAGRDATGLTLVVAAWMRYVSGWDENGDPIDVKDPLATQLAALWCDDPEQTVAGFLTLAEVFPEALRKDASFAATLSRALADLVETGARGSAARFGG